MTVTQRDVLEALKLLEENHPQRIGHTAKEIAEIVDLDSRSIGGRLQGLLKKRKIVDVTRHLKRFKMYATTERGGKKPRKEAVKGEQEEVFLEAQQISHSIITYIKGLEEKNEALETRCRDMQERIQKLTEEILEYKNKKQIGGIKIPN